MAGVHKPAPVLSETLSDRIEIVADFPNTGSNTLFDYWVKADLLETWWPPVAKIEARLNGRYHYSWPSQNWHLRGTLTEFERGHRLEFSWKWDHERIDQTHVKVQFDPTSRGGTRLTLHHGNYGKDEEGRKIRGEHVEGWMYFLGKLQELLETNQS